MGTGKLLSYLAAAVLIVLALAVLCFGVLFVWASFAPGSNAQWPVIGLVTIFLGVLMLAGGIVLVVVASRSRPGEVTQNVTLKVDLPGNVNLDTLKCTSCGGVLTMDNIQMVAGAPVVHCPYCKTTYQLTEEPKW